MELGAGRLELAAVTFRAGKNEKYKGGVKLVAWRDVPEDLGFGGREQVQLVLEYACFSEVPAKNPTSLAMFLHEAYLRWREACARQHQGGGFQGLLSNLMSRRRSGRWIFPHFRRRRSLLVIG